MLPESEIEYNGYPPTIKVPSLSEEGISTNMPNIQLDTDNIQSAGGVTRMTDRDFKSTNFKSGEAGWSLRADGTFEANQTTIITKNPIVSTNFRKIISDSVTGISIWVSNGTTPNGNLTGVEGDICLNSSATGQLFYCTANGTTWSVV